MKTYFKKGDKSNKILQAKPKWHTKAGCFYECHNENETVFVANKIHHYDEEKGTIEVPEWFFQLKFGKK